MNLAERFPDLVRPEQRAGFKGWITEPRSLSTVMRSLRDDNALDYLSSITGVDYFPEDALEVVYHVYSSRENSGTEIKVRIPRQDPHVPSLVDVFPGAEFQEREIWDLFGIHFDGHPDLRRILLWEGFSGHPLRKDWHEPAFEEEAKPFASRWPSAQPEALKHSSEEKREKRIPVQLTDEGLEPDPDESLYVALEKSPFATNRSLRTEQMVVNLGPQHPSTHGVFRMAVLLDGEIIVDLKPVMGYLHRCHEKIGERNTYLGNIPFTDRLDYLTSLSNNFAYVLAVEQLLGIRPPERAEYLRVILAELTRISSHVWAIGFLLNDLGAFFTPVLYAIEERELIIDLFEAITGSRMMCNFFRFGGLAADLDAAVLEKIHGLVHDRLPRKMEELERYLTENEIVLERCVGVGLLPREKAIAFSTAGPILRASGVPYDVRKAAPYSVYDRFQWDVICRSGCDVYDRYRVRVEEIHQSLRIIRQALETLPGGPIFAGKPNNQIRVPPGESFSRVEGPKGEMGFYIVSNGTANPWRYHVRAPSFINLTALAEMCRGSKIADAMAVLGSIDIILGETDR